MKTIIIAEAGVNHNGSLSRALEMVRVAADAGADYIKFQTFRTEALVSPSAQKAEYQKENCNYGDDSQFAMLKKLELSYEDFRRIAEECRSVGIGFMSTPFDMDSIDFLAGFGMDYWKIPSGEITNLPYLRKIASKGGRIILSTGMSTMQEVEDAVSALENAGQSRSDIILLHCTTRYPTPYKDVNLLAMNALSSLGCAGVGYSDHTEGIEVSLAATALGAKVIEKHFTLDRTLPGPDHKASLDPVGLWALVKGVRHVEECLGKAEKCVTPGESRNIAVARKSIVAAHEIAEGQIIAEDDITTRRPATGLSPMLWDVVIGSTAPRSYKPGEEIEL